MGLSKSQISFPITLVNKFVAVKSSPLLPVLVIVSVSLPLPPSIVSYASLAILIVSAPVAAVIVPFTLLNVIPLKSIASLELVPANVIASLAPDVPLLL